MLRLTFFLQKPAKCKPPEVIEEQPKTTVKQQDKINFAKTEENPSESIKKTEDEEQQQQELNIPEIISEDPINEPAQTEESLELEVFKETQPGSTETQQEEISFVTPAEKPSESIKKTEDEEQQQQELNIPEIISEDPINKPAQTEESLELEVFKETQPGRTETQQEEISFVTPAEKPSESIKKTEDEEQQQQELNIPEIISEDPINKPAQTEDSLELEVFKETQPGSTETQQEETSFVTPAEKPSESIKKTEDEEQQQQELNIPEIISEDPINKPEQTEESLELEVFKETQPGRTETQQEEISFVTPAEKPSESIKKTEDEEQQQQELNIPEIISEDPFNKPAQTEESLELEVFKETQPGSTETQQEEISFVTPAEKPSESIKKTEDEEQQQQELNIPEIISEDPINGLLAEDPKIPSIGEAPREGIEDSIIPPNIANVTEADFRFGPLLGKGGFAKVYLAKFERTDQVVAVKTFKKRNIFGDLDCLIPERNILRLAKQAHQPFVMNIVASFQTQSHACLAMDLAAAGDLKKQLKKRRFDEPAVVFYSACIVSGLQFLHDNNIIHRDLKLENILMDESGYVKIADFSFSKQGVGYGEEVHTHCGTAYYMAPEIVRKERYTRAVDWWAIGVIIYRMLLREFPFDGLSAKGISRSILNNEPKYPKNLSPTARDITVNLLNKDPSKRLGSTLTGAEDVKRSAFFKNMDWTALSEKRLEPPYIPIIKKMKDKKFKRKPGLKPSQYPVDDRIQKYFKDFDYFPGTS
ncbi:serine/threonine-protein kinase N-like [Xenopus laevis]|uniref:Serine/threonine-protein kinase N-like n=1 Tax=Xenopus laevis TaxID=8355 RepID=A0A8J1N2R5_XENLA|nr:serine/threonine-protein kinase N-like [Xenopus laevis]